MMMHSEYAGVCTLLAIETPQHRRSALQSRQHHFAMLTARAESCFKGLRLAIMRLLHEGQSLATPGSLCLRTPTLEALPSLFLRQILHSRMAQQFEASKGQEHTRNEWSELLDFHTAISLSIRVKTSNCQVDVPTTVTLRAPYGMHNAQQIAIQPDKSTLGLPHDHQWHCSKMGFQEICWWQGSLVDFANCQTCYNMKVKIVFCIKSTCSLAVHAHQVSLS